MAGYVVNKSGATHQVSDEDFARLTSKDNPNPKEAGFRAATADEIKAWFTMQDLKPPAGEHNPKAAKAEKADKAEEAESEAAAEPAG